MTALKTFRSLLISTAVGVLLAVSGSANAWVEGAVFCGDTQKNFAVNAIRPGVFKIYVSDGSEIQYNARQNGRVLEFEMDWVLGQICSEPPDPHWLDQVVNTLLSIAREASAQAQRDCENTHGSESCRDYSMQLVATGVRG